MALNIFDEFRSTAIILMTEVQIVLNLASGSLFQGLFLRP